MLFDPVDVGMADGKDHGAVVLDGQQGGVALDAQVGRPCEVVLARRWPNPER